MKNDSRDKDLRLQSIQAKVNRSFDFVCVLHVLLVQLNLLRDRNRAEDERVSKENELVNIYPNRNLDESFHLLQKIKAAEQQISELKESVHRLKTQLQDTESQLLRLNQNEQKLKEEGETARRQLVEVQQSETKFKANLEDAEKKVASYL